MDELEDLPEEEEPATLPRRSYTERTGGPGSVRTSTSTSSSYAPQSGPFFFIQLSSSSNSPMLLVITIGSRSYMLCLRLLRRVNLTVEVSLVDNVYLAYTQSQCLEVGPKLDMQRVGATSLQTADVVQWGRDAT